MTPILAILAIAGLAVTLLLVAVAYFACAISHLADHTPPGWVHGRLLSLLPPQPGEGRALLGARGEVAQPDEAGAPAHR